MTMNEDSLEDMKFARNYLVTLYNFLIKMYLLKRMSKNVRFTF